MNSPQLIGLGGHQHSAGGRAPSTVSSGRLHILSQVPLVNHAVNMAQYTARCTYLL